MTGQKNSVSAPGLERDRAKSLAQMADQYRKAYTLKKKNQDPYALLKKLAYRRARSGMALHQCAAKRPLPCCRHLAA
jgi:hypothetical protein